MTSENESGVEETVERMNLNTKPKKYMLFSDFDCTISQKHVYSHSHGAQLPTFKSKYNINDIKDWFGGEERIEQLKKHYQKLENMGIELVIISYGYSTVINHCLEELGMLELFSSCHGRDSATLVNVGFNKSGLINSMMFQENCSRECSIFLDDDVNNVEQVKKNEICAYVFVPSDGIDEEIMAGCEKFFEDRQKGEPLTEFDITPVPEIGN